MEVYKGIDISTHNGNVNIKRVRDAGYKRVGIRAGYGNNNTDKMFNQNALACVNLGVPVILYWFSYAYTVEMAKREECRNKKPDIVYVFGGTDKEEQEEEG